MRLDIAHLQHLQHGLADIRPHAGSHQLLLQGHRLPQVGVRLAQDGVQLHCLRQGWSVALHKPAVQWEKNSGGSDSEGCCRMVSDWHRIECSFTACASRDCCPTRASCLVRTEFEVAAVTGCCRMVSDWHRIECCERSATYGVCAAGWCRLTQHEVQLQCLC